MSRELSNSRQRLFILEDRVGDVVVSWLYLYTVSLPSRYLGVIEEVNTSEAFRRQGRATRLIGEAIELGRSIGLDCIELTVREDKPGLQTFYASLGFKDRKNRTMRLVL